MGTPAEKTKPIVPKDLPKPKPGTTFNFKSIPLVKTFYKFFSFVYYIIQCIVQWTSFLSSDTMENSYTCGHYSKVL